MSETHLDQPSEPREPQAAPHPANSKTGFQWPIDPALGLGVAGTTVFYAIVLQPSMKETMLHRYTTEHAVEYVIVALFIWGLADILCKILSFPREFLAQRHHWLPARKGREPIGNAQVLLNQLQRLPRWLQESKIGKRLSLALEYLIEQGSAKDFREHLQYLSEQDEDTTHATYTLSRFVITVTPILGFLGTVVHFGTALSGISFEEMTDRLAVVVGEMGTAFNTTTVALAAAMTMMFLVFICERAERSFVRTADRLTEHELLTRFEVKDANLSPFLSAIASANQDSLQAIDASLRTQIEVWERNLQSLFERFDARQKQETLSWQDALETLRQRHEAYDADRTERFRKSLTVMESRQDQHMAQIQETLERAVCLREDFAGFAKIMENLAEGDGRLIELQATLADNLRVLHETQQIDEALHGLTAAIHLLTSRHRPGLQDAA